MWTKDGLRGLVQNLLSERRFIGADCEPYLHRSGGGKMECRPPTEQRGLDASRNLDSSVDELEAPSAEPSDSFQTVVETHWTPVYRLLYTLTGNPHDSEDLTQETFLRALRRWDTFKQGTNLRAWLWRIGTNAFFDVKRRRQTLKFGPLAEDIESEDISAVDQVEIEEQAELVRAALEDLSEMNRLVFHLRVAEDLSFKEISELAEISEIAARQHMHQARTKLLKRFGDRYGMGKS